MRRDRGWFVPGAATNQLGNAEVDEPDAAVVTKHQLRWGYLGVGEPALVCCVERPAGFEANHKRLRRLEKPPSIEQIAQTATTQVLHHPEERRFTVDIDVAPVEHLGDVRMTQRSGELGLLAEITAEFFGARKLGAHNLEGDRLIAFKIKRVRDDRVGAGRDNLSNAVPVSKHSAHKAAACEPSVVGSIICFKIFAIHRGQNLPLLLDRVAAGPRCHRRVATLVRHTGPVTDIEATDADQAEVLALADDVEQTNPATRRRRPDRGLLTASFVIAAGLALIVWGFFTAITGDEGIERPLAIESVSPVENAVQVLQQERIAVDLEFGHEAVLILDGIELETTNIGELEAQPGEQVALPPTAIFDPGNAVISFIPNENAAITELTQGRHMARVMYWRLDEGRENAKSYNWSFVVV